MIEAKLARLNVQIARVDSDMARLIAEHPQDMRDVAHWRFYRNTLRTRRLMMAQTERVWCLSLLQHLSPTPGQGN